MRLLFLSLLLLSGCSHNTNITPESTEFSEINDLKSLEGTYLNRGSGYEFLSNVIWKNDSNKDRLTYAELINVATEGDSVFVKAILNDCAIYESEFKLGSDFEVENGVIKLRKEYALSSLDHIGPYAKEGVIGIDESGDGKYISNESGAGLIFILIPFGGSSSTEYVFKRVESDKIYELCEKNK